MWCQVMCVIHDINELHAVECTLSNLGQRPTKLWKITTVLYILQFSLKNSRITNQKYMFKIISASAALKSES